MFGLVAPGAPGTSAPVPPMWYACVMATSSKNKSSGGNNQTVKLVAAVVCLAVAGGLLAWNFGLLSFGGGGSNTPTMSADDQKITNEEAEKNKAKFEQTPPARRSAAGAQ